ncbi:MAG: protein kinase domain-containing protein [Oscillospiraceae bacterium]
MNSGQIVTAVLEEGSPLGSTLDFVVDANAPRGGMKHTFFSPDRKYAVQFFNDPRDGHNPNIQDVSAPSSAFIIPPCRSRRGSARQYGKDRGVLPQPVLLACRDSQPAGVRDSLPDLSAEVLFGGNASTNGLNLKGKDKKSNWFTGRLRKYIAPEEKGDFRTMLGAAICLSRSIRRMHQAGLAHSDLSCNNVLIDPKSGSTVVIDIDSLVVPGKYPPEVCGTSGYIAPEVLATLEYDYNDPRRCLPCVSTDLHALPVLIYEYLFLRHPLKGPKIHSAASAEEDDYLAMGPEALFIENPNDRSNRPPDLNVTIQSLSKGLEQLFLRAFVDGLHDPSQRPTAMEWERELLRAWDRLVKCGNPGCEKKWFILRDESAPVCPFCGTRLRDRVIRLGFKSMMRGRNGVYRDNGEAIAYDGMPLYDWHVSSAVHNDEKAGTDMRAYICRHNGMWLLVNNGVEGMTSPSGRLVPKGQAVELRDGAVFRMTDRDDGLLCEVSVY